MSDTNIGRELLSQGIVLSTVDRDLDADARVTQLRDAVLQSIDAKDRISVIQGGILWEIQKFEYWRNYSFSSFEEYVEEELEFKRRKAYYLIEIFDKFVNELQIPMSQMNDMEWSKAKELVKVIDSSNYEELLDKIKSMSVKKVKEMVKDMLGLTSADDDDEETEKFHEKTFALTDDQNYNVNQALEAARGQSGSTKAGHLLDIIATDYLSGTLTDDIGSVEEFSKRVDRILKNLKRIGINVEKWEFEKGINPKIDKIMEEEA